MLPDDVELAICCGGEVCADCWEFDRTCLDAVACDERKRGWKECGCSEKPPKMLS